MSAAGQKAKKRSQHWGSNNEETTLQFIAEPRVLEAHLVAFEVQTSTTPPIAQLTLGTAPALYVPSSTEGFLDPRAKPPLDSCTDETAEQDQTQTIPQAPPRLLQLPDNPSN